MKVHFSHDSKNVDRQRRRTHGVFQVQRCWGWLGDCQKTHKWMYPWGHRSTEHTYNVAIYSAFLCELMHLLSVPVKRRASLELPTSCVTLSECWHCPVHEVGAELVPTSQSHFENMLRWWIWKYLKEAGAHALFLWALPLRLLVHFQRLNAASCHSFRHREGYCTTSADRPSTFLPTHF